MAIKISRKFFQKQKVTRKIVYGDLDTITDDHRFIIPNFRVLIIPIRSNFLEMFAGNADQSSLLMYLLLLVRMMSNSTYSGNASTHIPGNSCSTLDSSRLMITSRTFRQIYLTFVKVVFLRQILIARDPLRLVRVRFTIRKTLKISRKTKRKSTNHSQALSQRNRNI